MRRKVVRYEYCNGRAGGNKKAAAARGKVLRQAETIRKTIRNRKMTVSAVGKGNLYEDERS